MGRERSYSNGNRTFKPSKGFAKRAAEADADPCSKQRSETPNISASGRFRVTKPNEDKKVAFVIKFLKTSNYQRAPNKKKRKFAVQRSY